MDPPAAAPNLNGEDGTDSFSADPAAAAEPNTNAFFGAGSAPPSSAGFAAAVAPNAKVGFGAAAPKVIPPPAPAPLPPKVIPPPPPFFSFSISSSIAFWAACACCLFFCRKEAGSSLITVFAGAKSDFGSGDAGADSGRGVVAASAAAALATAPLPERGGVGGISSTSSKLYTRDGPGTPGALFASLFSSFSRSVSGSASKLYLSPTPPAGAVAPVGALKEGGAPKSRWFRLPPRFAGTSGVPPLGAPKTKPWPFSAEPPSLVSFVAAALAAARTWSCFCVKMESLEGGLKAGTGEGASATGSTAATAAALPCTPTRDPEAGRAGDAPLVGPTPPVAIFFAKGGEVGRATGGRLWVLAAALARLWLKSSRRTGVAGGGEAPPPPIESSVMRIRRAVSVVRRDPLPCPGDPMFCFPAPGSSIGLLGITACGAAAFLEPDDWSGRERLACPASASPPYSRASFDGGASGDASAGLERFRPEPAPELRIGVHCAGPARPPLPNARNPGVRAPEPPGAAVGVPWRGSPDAAACCSRPAGFAGGWSPNPGLKPGKEVPV